MIGKRAHQQEVAEKKFNSYVLIITELISRVQRNPLTDYSQELENLHKMAPEDKGIILAAERECYKNGKRQV